MDKEEEQSISESNEVERNRKKSSEESSKPTETINEEREQGISKSDEIKKKRKSSETSGKLSENTDGRGEVGTSKSDEVKKKRKKSTEELSSDAKDSNENSENVILIEEANKNEDPIENTTNHNKEDWQSSLSSDFRNKIVKKLVDALSAKDENSAKMNKIIGGSDAYAKLIEENMMKIATCKAQYIHFIYEKLEQIKNGSLDKVLKETEELILSNKTPNDAAIPKQNKESPPSDKIKNDFLENGKLMKIRELGRSVVCLTWMKWLKHSQKCRLDNQANDPEFCHSLHCKEIISFLNHIDTCTAGRNCVFPKCRFFKSICFAHWITCDSVNCQNCQIFGDHASKIFKNISVEGNNEITNDESTPSTSRENRSIRVLNAELMPSTSGMNRANNSVQHNSLINQKSPPGNQHQGRNPPANTTPPTLQNLLHFARTPGNLHNFESQTSGNFTNYNTRPVTYQNKQPSLVTGGSTQRYMPWDPPKPYQSRLSAQPSSTTVNGTITPSDNASSNNTVTSSNIRIESVWSQNRPAVDNPGVQLNRPTNSSATQYNYPLRRIINSAIIRAIRYHHQSSKNEAENEREDDNENANNNNGAENENDETENDNDNDGQNNSENNEIECIELNETQ